MTPKMSCENSREKVDGAGQYEKPGGEKVKTTSPAILVEYVVGSVRADR